MLMYNLTFIVISDYMAHLGTYLGICRLEAVHFSAAPLSPTSFDIDLNNSLFTKNQWQNLIWDRRFGNDIPKTEVKSLSCQN